LLVWSLADAIGQAGGSVPLGLVASGLIFGAFSILLWATLAIAIPLLKRSFGLPALIAWYISGTVAVLAPILLFGVLRAWWELPRRNLKELARRLRVRPVQRGDLAWSVAVLLLIVLGSGMIFALARHYDPYFRPSPDFLRQPAGWHAWVLIAWIPLFITNIVGEEICWRGYVLPRQEAAWGRWAWLLNGGLWCLFHWSFGWRVMLLLLPIALLLPWIVQRRRNTSVGLLIHAIFNAAGFLAAVSGRSNL
jgi:membrane protease YdiL (CAAX protease family)